MSRAKQRFRARLAMVAVAAALALTGCESDDPVFPAPEGPPSPPASFYPLSSGNQWRYDLTFALRIQDEETGDLILSDTLRAEGAARLIGTESFDGREYQVEEFVVSQDGSTDTTWTRLRQDTTGLYMADLSSRLRPFIEHGGTVAPPEELVRLRYPLSTGATWLIYGGVDSMVATVEALDTIGVSSGRTEAFRIKVDLPYARPDDWRRVWYGRCGRIRFAWHREVVAIDVGTGKQSRVITEETETLTALDLVEPGGCKLTP